MDKQYDFDLEDLLEQAKKDASWEPDEKKREKLTKSLAEALN